jgi:predicted alpha-1,2-mannosidase
MLKRLHFLQVHLLIGILYLMLCFISANELKAQKFTQYVDPLIGSGGHGHVFVGASVPFGAVQLGPNNIYKGWDWCSGYHYSDSLIIGFSHVHLSGTGIGDLADVLFMPIAGEVKLDKGKQTFPHNGFLSTFSHKNEVVKPGYYSVKMDNGVAVKLTASERVGFHQYQFPKGKDAHVMIDLKEGINDKSTDTYLEQIDEHTLIGYRFSSGWAKDQKVFFAIHSSKPWKNIQIYNEDKLLSDKKGQGNSIKGVIEFEQGAFVELKVGISPVSSENALANIKAEIPNWDFQAVVNKADEKWNKELSRINIQTKTVSDKRIFYTSLFHTMIHPSLFNDYNKDYQGTDKKNHTSSTNNYSIFSTWDTYRAEHPLLNLIAPDRVSDMIKSMLSIFDEQGYLPIWHLNANETGTMVGISSLQIIAEAYLKGIRNYDVEKAYVALKTTAMSDLRGLDYVQKLQIIPADVKIRRTVANALELAISDGSIALMAKEMGKMTDYEYFKKRSENYKLYYDSLSGFFRGKMTNGLWSSNFDPIKSTMPWSADYAEGNAWQYLWLVPQDISGLKKLLGGEKIFRSRLDQFFSENTKSNDEPLIDLTGLIGQYAHGNEPSHHISYLYAYAGQQWKTAEKVRYIMREFYHDDPDGIIGNEDCGQMSAWYIFSSIGFYPVFPASQIYVLGSPLFEKTTIKLPNNKLFTVIAKGASVENSYIQKISINGKIIKEPFFTHQQLMKGGILELTMGSKPKQ